MIKVEATGTVVKTGGYPKLMVSRDTGAIVLFSGQSTGTLIKAVGYEKTGYFSDAWADSLFSEFSGTVTLYSEA